MACDNCSCVECEGQREAVELARRLNELSVPEFVEVMRLLRGPVRLAAHGDPVGSTDYIRLKVTRG